MTAPEVRRRKDTRETDQKRKPKQDEELKSSHSRKSSSSFISRQ
jgi:hypothetical protein